MDEKSLRQCYADECNEILNKIKSESYIDENIAMPLSKKGIEILIKIGLIEIKYENQKLYHFSELGKNLKDKNLVINVNDIKKFI
jgi:phosphotransferase system IIA component